MEVSSTGSAKAEALGRDGVPSSIGVHDAGGWCWVGRCHEMLGVADSITAPHARCTVLGGAGYSSSRCYCTLYVVQHNADYLVSRPIRSCVSVSMSRSCSQIAGLQD